MSGYPRYPNQGPPPPGGQPFAFRGAAAPPGGGYQSGPPPPPGAGYGSPPAQQQPPPPQFQGQGLSTRMNQMNLGGPPPPQMGSHQPPPPGAHQPPPPGKFGAPPQGQFGYQQQPPAYGAGPPVGMPVQQQPPPPGAPPQPQFQPLTAPPPGAAGVGANQLSGLTPNSSFYAPPPNQATMQRIATPQRGGAAKSVGHDPFAGGAAAPPAAGPRTPAATGQSSAASPAGSASAFMEENVDWSIRHPKQMLQFTTESIPQSSQLSQNSKVVLGGVIRPFVALEEGIATIAPGPAGIVRCKKCRTYMNAFVSWFENGRRWRCNICGQANDCPSAYFCHLDPHTNTRRDKYDRPELSHSVVEYIAPNEYMVRPPQPPAYFFVFDVSAQAVTSGMLAHVAAAVKKVVLQDRCLPGGERTQIGFLSYDTSVQYFNLSKRGRREDDSGKAQPQMLTVSDLVELFVPLPPDDLLVNLNEHLDTVETFLEALPTMFAPPEPTRASPVLQNESALGPALKAAFTILKPLGGKMLVFNSVLPSVPNVDGVLNPRGDNPRLMGTDGEAPLLRPQSNWYKDTAVEFSRAQISVDLFITNYNYVDVATLTDLPKYTAGNFFSFANFSSPVDGARLEGAVYHTLTRPTALEAVMRVRCTRGLRVTNFYGNFYIRGQDLLALPNCSSDSSYGFTIQHEDPVIPSNVLTIQSALLYTSTEGERRIRVITTVLPVVTDLKSVTNSIDATVFVSLLSKQGIDFALKNSPGAARNKLVQSCLDVIKTARSKPQTSRMPGAPPPGAFGAQNGEADHDGIPSHLALLPLMTLGMLKNIAFRGGTDVHPDERCSAMQVVSSMWVGDQFKSLLYPKMFRIDKMEPDAGSPFEEAADGENDRTGNHMPTEVCAGPTGRKVRLPQMLNLTVNALSSEGIYCLENGSDAYIWVGRQADPGLLRVLFGEESIENLNHPEVREILFSLCCYMFMNSLFINTLVL